MEAACQRQRKRECWASRRGGFTAPSTETYLPARKTERAAAQRAGVNEMKMESLAQRISSRPALLLKSQGSLERLPLHHGCIPAWACFAEETCAWSRKIWLLLSTLTPQLELGCTSFQLPLLHHICALMPSLPPEGPCTRQSLTAFTAAGIKQK